MQTLKRLLGLALLLWLGTATLARAAAPTAADFARRSAFLSATLSPTGDSIAVTFWHDDVVGLAVLDAKTKKPTASTWFTHGHHVVGYWWASDKRIVMALGKRWGALDQPVPTGELYGMDADGSQKMYLYGYQAGGTTGTHIGGPKGEAGFAWVVDPVLSDPDHALIAVNRLGQNGRFLPGITLEMLDVHNGNRRRVGYIEAGRGAPNGLQTIAVAADDKGQPRYAIVQNDRDEPVEMKRTSDDWVAVRAHKQDAEVDLLGISADGRKAYLLSPEDGDLLCARARDLETNSLETLSCGEGVDAQLAFKAVDGRPVALNYEAGKPQSVQMGGADSPEARAYGALLKAFAGQRVRIVSHTQDGRKLVALVDSDRNPGDYYLFDSATKSADYLFSQAEWIDPEAMTAVQPFEVKARDGKVLHGYVTSRGGLKPEKRPLVLLVHGGPYDERDSWEWQPEPQYLASLGYAVMQVNFRGSDGYGRAFMNAGAREWGGAMQDDLTDAVRWAIAAGIADPARICIMGASYGGYAAMMSAVREPALYRCAITMAGPVDLVSWTRDADTADYGFGRLYQRDVLGDDEARRKDSPIHYLDRLQAPVLIVHGTNDKRVPFSQARELRAELDRLHKPYEWLPFDGEEHGFYVEMNYEKYLLAVKSFLAKNIGPGMPGAAAEGDKK